MRSFFFLAMGLVLGGCSGFSDVPDDACKKQHMKDTSDGEIAVCDELYAQEPYVHLPKPTDDEAFVGVEGSEFVTVNGAKYGGLDTDAEIDRHGFVLYQILIDGHSADDSRPAIEFKKSLFFEELYGRAAEGLVSRRISSTTGAMWEDMPSLPVRVEFPTEPANEPIVRVVNLDEAVTAADGSCMPALSSYGDEATFPPGSKVELRADRIPSMHEFGDHHFVMTWLVDGAEDGLLMGSEWYRGPIDIARGTLEVTTTYRGFGHATPGYVANLNLDLVDDGGEPCTP